MFNAVCFMMLDNTPSTNIVAFQFSIDIEITCYEFINKTMRISFIFLAKMFISHKNFTRNGVKSPAVSGFACKYINRALQKISIHIS